MSKELKMHTNNLVAKNIEKLTALFPNCITETQNAEGKIIKGVDFDLLRQELSETIIEGDKERYRLDWVGKKEAILTANAPIPKTLRPCCEESVNFDTTQNLFIEGDNLDALKLLQETYLGKVKMIYIDPPYNTGNDFIYNDDFAETVDDFLARSNQVDEEGNRLVTNTESNGRFHSDWLSMMYSRLKLARNLLTDDGVIFISIDDNEQANLKKICDEIFGGINFISTLIWANKEGGGSSDSNLFRIKHEYILCYARNNSNIEINGIPISNLERYTQSDEFIKTRGPYYLQKLGMGSIQYSSTLDYPIIAPDKSIITPKDNNKGKKACWRWSQKKFFWGIKNNFIEIKKNSSGIWTVYTKQYLNCDNEGNLITRTQQPLGIIDNYSSTQASKMLEKLQLTNTFNYSKPFELIYWLISRINSDDSIILDFFAGSSTTAHAVMQLNAEDRGNRRFIMVQLPEKTEEKSEAYKAGYQTIAEISKERIRRAGNKILADNAGKEGINQLDIGFRVLKIDSSNMKEVYYTPDDLSQTLLEHMESNIKKDRSAEDLLFQVMLDWGIELSLPIEQKSVGNSILYYVGGNSLVACFDALTLDVINEIAKHQPLRVVSCESAIQHDQDKTNIKERFKQLSPETDVRFL
ncbi:MAG: site-specific DNA-methyltransferase [Pasteurella multocida]|nr:site-specific DNA-methyltransferase [Pasteurella multocida]